MATTGPIPLYNNPTPTPQYFKPWRFNISAIAQGQTTLVTLVIPSVTVLNMVVGQLVRFIIPPTYGIRQLNEVQGYVILITLPNQVTIDVDSRFFDPFIASSQPTPAQLIPVGDVNSGAINTTGAQSTKTFIDGSFRNISPNSR